MLHFIVIMLKRYSVQNRLVAATISYLFFCTVIENTVSRLMEQSSTMETDYKVIILLGKAQM